MTPLLMLAMELGAALAEKEHARLTREQLEFQRACNARPDGIYTSWLGVPSRSADCAGCGAPHEPGMLVCNYCRRPR